MKKKILIDIVHPAHVHFFKEFIRIIDKMGGEVLVTSREKDIAIELLDRLNIPHIPISTRGKGNLELMKELVVRNFGLFPDFLKDKQE